jgi:cell division protein FtsZ
MIEISEAAKTITESVDRDAKVIFGAVLDEKMKKGEIKITVIATGFSNISNGRYNSNQLVLEPEIISSSAMEIEKKKIKKDEKKDENITTYKSPLGGNDDDEWDIPTFIRKKK